MKKLFALPIAVMFIAQVSQAQQLPNYEEIKLEIGTDYKNAESQALEASNYILTAPFDGKDINRLKSLAFVIKWMSGTPDYTFSLDNVAQKIMKKNDDLLGLYIAALTKSVLEDNSLGKDDARLKMLAVRLVIKYCQDTSNNIKMTKSLRDLAEADAKGELEKALK